MKRTNPRNLAMALRFAELYGPTGRAPSEPALQLSLPPRSATAQALCEAFRDRSTLTMDFATLERRILASGKF